LDQLKSHSIVVADTGDFSLIEQYLPEDSTTNPTLILQAAKNPAFSNFIDDSIDFGLKNFETYQGGKKKK
jgi:transaldolase